MLLLLLQLQLQLQLPRRGGQQPRGGAGGWASCRTRLMAAPADQTS
jgi:hypothetical protein